jgi:hypothetical protein
MPVPVQVVITVATTFKGGILLLVNPLPLRVPVHTTCMYNSRKCNDLKDTDYK